MAAKTQDYTKIMQDMMGAFPVDMTAMQDAFKTQATFGEKLSKVALTAAEKSTEISTKWTKDTLAKVGTASVVKEDPADYSKVMTEFASAQAEMTAESMAAFAALLMFSGVSKSGSPALKAMISFPAAFSSAAFAVIDIVGEGFTRASVLAKNDIIIPSS